MSETNIEPTITESDLQKSIESLMALLDEEAPSEIAAREAMEKSMVATEGGLAAKTGAPPLNPELDMSGEEMEEFGTDHDHDLEEEHHRLIAQHLKMTPVEDPSMQKSMNQDYDLEQEEAFAKSLAEAFAEQEALVEAASESEFAKSLVLGTIEGLSVAHEEFQKSLSALESRNDDKIAILAKGLAAIAQAVDEIRNEVVRVSNAPVRPMAKSVHGVQVLEKSFGGNGSADPSLMKSRVMGALERRVQEGKLDAFQLVKYETTGHLDPVLAKDIQSELGF
jgi:hypothetical protein